MPAITAVRSTVAFAVILLTACSQPAPPAPPPTPVTVADVISREVADWDEFTGRLEAIERVELKPRVSGVIDKVAYEEGQDVRKGDLLFVIDPRPYRAALDRAQAELVRARTRADLTAQEVTRGDKLLAARAISQEEYDQRVTASREATANVAAAAAAVESARLDLEFTRVLSPINGRAGRALVTAGNFVTSGQQATTLTTIVSLDPIYVEFEGDEQVYLKYTEMSQRGERPSSRDAQNPVYMALANETGFPHEGRMVFVDNALDPQTGTIRARALFDNKKRLFTPGLFARVKLIGSGTYRATLINDRAVGTDQSQKFVLVVDADNKVNYRPVKIGRLVDGLRVVHDGVKPGETIVVNGLQRVRPGMPVQPEKVPMDQGVVASDVLPVPKTVKLRRPQNGAGA